MDVAIITGSSGLIGSQASRFFHAKGFLVVGIDNDMRSYFFGAEASTASIQNQLRAELDRYQHYSIDIRAFDDLERIFSEYSTDVKAIVHTAAQPSHDWAAQNPQKDFTINANGTLNLLEATRNSCPDAVFIFTSTKW